MSLPVLDKLVIGRLRRADGAKPAEHHTTGVYCLDEEESTCRSAVILMRNAVSYDARDADIKSLMDFMSDERKVPSTPNKMGGYDRTKSSHEGEPEWRHAFRKDGTEALWLNALCRKQATFGAKYDFGQHNESIPLDANTPALVTRCLYFSRCLAAEMERLRTENAGTGGFLSESKPIDPGKYNGVHVNFYPDGNAGVQPHYDKEGDLVEGYPIFSFTFLGGKKLLARPFSIYKCDKTKLADIVLDNGDLLVMQGEMQKYFLHGVEKKPGRNYEGAARLNLTVRAFSKDAVEAVSDKKQRCASKYGGNDACM